MMLDGLTVLPRPGSRLRTPVPRTTLPEGFRDPASGHGWDGAPVWTEFSRSDGRVGVVVRHRAPEATAVSVAVSGWFRPDPPAACDLEPVGHGWWAAAFTVPGDWQASYSFLEHRGPVGRTEFPAGPVPDRESGQGAAPWHGGDLHRLPRLVPGDPGLRRATVSEVARVCPRRPWLDAYGTPCPEMTVTLPARSPEEPVVRLWRSPSARPETPVPLVVVFDGEGHVDRLGTPLVLSYAEQAGVVPPVAVAFVSAGPARSEDLGVPGGQAEWVAGVLVPRLHAEGVLGAVDRTGTVVTGASFGGLSALFALARSGGRIGAAVAQSVSYWRYRTPDLDNALAAALRGGDAVVRLQSGRYEGDSAQRAQELAALLRRQGGDATARTVSGGHDWAWWIPEMVEELGGLLSRSGRP